MANTCKYYKQKKQVSYDNGVTWQDVVPLEYQKGSLYESQSSDCGVQYIERWVDSGTTCSGASGYDKYVLQIKQTSNDGGSTWTTTSDSRLGSLIEANSTDCGYTPIIPANTKLMALYSDGMTYTLPCNSSVMLTSGETRPDGYNVSAMTSAFIGDCVETIDELCFAVSYLGSHLTSVTIPNTVTRIVGGVVKRSNSRTIYGAFAACAKLKSITLPPNLDSIEGAVFYDCSELTSINFPSGITSIGDYAFWECASLNVDVVLPSTCTSIGERAFQGTIVKSLSGGTINIGKEAFMQTDLQTINLEGGTIEYEAFYGCTALTSCNLGNVTSIGQNAFYGCSGLTSVTIPSSVTSIGIGAFEHCSSLTSITIPDSVANIGYGAFGYCTSLTSCTIGNSVTSIGEYAFYKCISLSSITINATTPPTLSNVNAFSKTNDCPIYVPAQSVDAYKTASGWSTYASRITAIP